MCLSPKIIRNRSLHYSVDMPLTISVPCGKCEECRKHFKDDWFVRCFSQWQICKDSTYFYTLTYNNEHLPRTCGVPCFSKDDLQKFFKRLRKCLQEYGVLLRYFVTCEYGEKYGRPHYHVIFYLSSSINSYIFYTLVEKTWNYGFVKYGDNVGLITSHHGIKYVTKYVCKDMSFESNRVDLKTKIYLRFYNLFFYLQKRGCIPLDFVFGQSSERFIIYSFDGSKRNTQKDIAISCPTAYKVLVKANKMLASASPFHLQSTKLGSNLIENLSSYDELSATIRFPLSDGSVTTFRLPRYFHRLLWYDRIENENDGKFTTYRLNERGKRHLLSKLSSDVEREEIRLRNIIANYRQLMPNVIPQLEKLDGVYFDDVHDVQYFLQNFDLSVRTLAIYSIVFKGRICPFNFDDLPLTHVLVEDNYSSYVGYCLDFVKDVDFGQMYLDNVLFSFLNHFTWDNHPFFKPYDFALQILNACDLSFRTSKSLADIRREKLTRSVREYFNTFNIV